jgi:CheY-like chemotaxis protein
LIVAPGRRPDRRFAAARPGAGRGEAPKRAPKPAYPSARATFSSDRARDPRRYSPRIAAAAARARARPPLDSPVHDPAGPSGHTSARLLVVDDDPLSSSLQAHLALLLGHAATVENDPERAVELALSGEFDAMLLDLGMPQVDGFEALRRLREREAAVERAPLPVIAVTGYASEADRLRCLMAGFNEHLSKPVQASTLGASIARVLAPHRADGTDAAGDAPLPRDCDAERLRATVRRLGDVKPDDRSFAPTVTESFALRSAQLIESLRAAIDARDGEQAARAAYALRASAEFLGALRLATMSGELDAALRPSTSSGVQDAALRPSAGSGAQDAARWEAARALLAAIDREHQAVLTLLFESSR